MAANGVALGGDAAYSADQGDVLYVASLAGNYNITFYEVSGAVGVASALAKGVQGGGTDGVLILDTDDGHLYVDANGGPNGVVEAQINLTGVTDLDQGNFLGITLFQGTLP
jgi:hypothetical protein